MRKVTKLFISKAQSIDEKAMTAKFKISDGNVDRMGEIVDQESWDFANFLQNPLLLWGHDPSQPKNVLGQITALEYDPKENATIATAQFDTDINDNAALIFNQVARGTLRCTSVGFIPHEEAVENDIPTLKNCELLEVSVVPIPANPRAIALAFSEGTINKKDASFLIESMEREIKLLSKELNNGTKELVMSKVAKSINAIKNKAASTDLSDADTKFLTDMLTAINECDTMCDTMCEKMDAVVKSLADFLGVEDPDADAGEDDGEGDGADAGDGEPMPPAKSLKSTKQKANDGSDDQSGAESEDDGADEAEEVSEDTELTPEQEKEFEAELAKELAELQTK
jgi:HK97 family phage prohead protease